MDLVCVVDPNDEMTVSKLGSIYGRDDEGIEITICSKTKSALEDGDYISPSVMLTKENALKLATYILDQLMSHKS